MKFLVDAQLPRTLVEWLVRRGYDALHVDEANLHSRGDAGIWRHAIAGDRIVISKDDDFFHLANRQGDAGRLLWVRVGNCRSFVLLARFEAAWPAIEAAFGDGQRIVELR